MDEFIHETRYIAPKNSVLTLLLPPKAMQKFDEAKYIKTKSLLGIESNALSCISHH